MSEEAADAGSVEGSIKVFVVPSDAGQEVEFELTSDGTPSPDWPDGADEVWVPSTSVAAGTRLRVESAFNCGESVESSEITVSEPAPLPTSLGTLAVATSVGPLLLWTNSAGCVDRVPTVYTDVEVALTPEAQPFADVLRYSLLVDGEHYRSTDYDEYDEELDSGGWLLRRPISGSEHGPGKDRVYATCTPHEGGELGVAATQHELQMVALLPDGTTITSDVVGVDLTCPSCEAEGGTDCNATDGGVITDEAVDASASSPTTDPSAATDAGPDTATPGTATPGTARPDTATPDTATTYAPDGSQSDTSVLDDNSSATTTATVATSTNAAPHTTTATSTVHSSTPSAAPVAPNHTAPTRDDATSHPPSGDTNDAPDASVSPHSEATANEHDVTTASDVAANDPVVAGGAPDASVDAGKSEPIVRSKKRDSGCSVGTSTTPERSTVALLVALVGAAVGTRRAQRRGAAVN